ncbi:adenosylcobinamide-GDP ribazoletransferase [Paenibacillus puldeungensis]|uniref:Adenosylcobinamide-GDP ribazoletransferase n=1 Tax=Paenibacillus puldeungensis TaxID=696536 RepID=A0ABW3S3E0_9BACL
MSRKDRPILAAFQFLSRFPIRVELDFTPDLLRRSAKYYPLVGAVIGLLIWAAAAIFSLALPALPAAVLTLVVWVWITGGLHLDGWMDTADGLLSYRSRDKMLEIMKDSRVGAMGVMACVLLLLLKMSLIVSLLEKGPFYTGLAFMTAPVWSRWFMTWAMRTWPKARQGEGLASHFQGFETRAAVHSGVLAFLLSASGMLLAEISLVGRGTELPWLQLLFYFLLHPILAWGMGTWAARRINAKLGGLTGDTYGALNEGLEVLLLLFAVILFR